MQTHLCVCERAHTHVLATRVETQTPVCGHTGTQETGMHIPRVHMSPLTERQPLCSHEHT